MKFSIKNDLSKNNYFGILKPNEEEFIMSYEKKLGISKDDYIVYKYNNLGFRCDDFKTSHDGLHILFAGCSETEGAANKIEDVWAHILYKKIKDTNKVSGYYNVGKSGLTISTVVMNILQYIEDYGCPDYIFAQFPDQTRYITWSEEDGFYPQYLALGKDMGDITWAKFFKSHEEPSALNINILYNYFLLKNLIQFCQLKNIKLIWSSWHNPTYEYLTRNIEDSAGCIETNVPSKEHWSIKLEDLTARDNYHLGRGFHRIWARKFYEEFINDQNIKNNNR